MARKASPPTGAVGPLSAIQALVRSTPAHTPDAFRNFKLCSLRPEGFRDARCASPFFCSLSCKKYPASVARVRAVCSRGRSFLGLFLDGCLGFPFPPSKKRRFQNCQERA